MGASYFTSQYGIVNFNVDSLNLPSLLLGIKIVAGFWLVTCLKSSCKLYKNSNSVQTLALDSIARSLHLVTARPEASIATAPALMPSSPIRKPIDPIYSDI